VTSDWGAAAVSDAVDRLLDQLKLNRAIQVI
jgi:hypothetical protein